MSVNALSSFVTVGMPKPIRANITIWIRQEWFHSISIIFAQMIAKLCLGSLTSCKASAIKKHCCESETKSMLGVDGCNSVLFEND